MHSILLAIAQWLEGTYWGEMARESLYAYPFVQLTHFTGLSIWLGTNFALDLRLLGSRQQAHDGGAGGGLAVCVELDWFLHRSGGWFLAVLRACDKFHGQHRVSVEIGIFRSAGVDLSRFRAEEGARLGQDDGDTGDCQAGRGDRDSAVDLRGHSGGFDPEQLTKQAKNESGDEPELTPRHSGPQRKALGALSKITPFN